MNTNTGARVLGGILILGLAATARGAVGGCNRPGHVCADAIFFDAIVETMVEKAAAIPHGAVAVRGGQILAVGAQAAIIATYQGRDTVMKDLGGGTTAILP